MDQLCNMVSLDLLHSRRDQDLFDSISASPMDTFQGQGQKKRSPLVNDLGSSSALIAV
jgi:hypothetical protein